jgi:hypothetical protein
VLQGQGLQVGGMGLVAWAAQLLVCVMVEWGRWVGTPTPSAGGRHLLDQRQAPRHPMILPAVVVEAAAEVCMLQAVQQRQQQQQQQQQRPLCRGGRGCTPSWARCPLQGMRSDEVVDSRLSIVVQIGHGTLWVWVHRVFERSPAPKLVFLQVLCGAAGFAVLWKRAWLCTIVYAMRWMLCPGWSLNEKCMLYVGGQELIEVAGGSRTDVRPTRQGVNHATSPLVFILYRQSTRP